MTLPNNITANVGEVGGAPLSVADTSSYLTQLASSLNGFTGPVSNAINYLLQQSNLPQAGAAYGTTSSVTGILNSFCWLGLGSACTFTPARTGRVFALFSGNWNPNNSGAGSWAAGVQCYYGLSTAPAAGAAQNPSNAVSAIGFYNVSDVQQTGTGQLFWQTLFTGGFVLALQTNQKYWFDVLMGSSGTNAGILEFGQMLVIEV